MLSHLDLFSGIGGFSLGLESAGVAKTVAFCDFDDYCQQVLKKNFPTVPIYNDVKELNYERLKADGINTIDIITGGYPCQPFSVAGRKKGEQDPRHVWPEMFRLIQELRPTWVIGENVSGHIKLGLDTVLENLESEGYTARTFSISAASIGANHKRERVWIMAHSERLGRTEGTQESKEFEGKESSDQSDKRSERLTESRARKDVADSNSEGPQGYRTAPELQKNFQEGQTSGQSNVGNSTINGWNESKSNKTPESVIGQSEEGRMLKPERASNVADTEGSNRNGYETDGEHGETETQEIFGDGSSVSRIGSWWEFEPDVGRVAHGVPKRVDRLKCLGNSVVPQIPYVLGLTIKKILENE